MPFPLAAIGAIASGLGGLFGSRDKGKESQVDAENQARMLQYREQNFDPMAPYQRLARGQMYASLARAWGYDKILGNDFLNHVSDIRSYPGTQAIGGRGYQDPSEAGFRRSGSTLGDIFSGITGGLAGGLALGRSSASGRDWDLEEIGPGGG